jgi:hypothetical protein
MDAIGEGILVNDLNLFAERIQYLKEMGYCQIGRKWKNGKGEMGLGRIARLDHPKWKNYLPKGIECEILREHYYRLNLSDDVIAEVPDNVYQHLPDSSTTKTGFCI